LITAFITLHRVAFEIKEALAPSPVEEVQEERVESKPIHVALSKERTTAKVEPTNDVKRRLARIMRRRKEQEQDQKSGLTPHEIEINF